MGKASESCTFRAKKDEKELFKAGAEKYGESLSDFFKNSAKLRLIKDKIPLEEKKIDSLMQFLQKECKR